MDTIITPMDAMPENIKFDELSRDMANIPGVHEVHDIHIWSISSDIYSLSSHVMIDALDIKSVNEIIGKINAMLEKKYNITHTVIQSECEKCVDITKSSSLNKSGI